VTTHLLIVCATILAVWAITARELRLIADRRAQHQREQAMHERAIVAPAAELAAAVQALTAAAAELRAAAPDLAPARVGHRVTVHTKKPDDSTLFGVVTGDYTDRLVLEDAEYVTAHGPQPLPGRQDVEKHDIAWLDVHGRVADALPARQEA
jgi:hypothetical protein